MFRSALALSLVVAASAGGLLGACSSDVSEKCAGGTVVDGVCTTTPTDPCAGGVVVDGVCEGKCTPDLCLEGNTCVGNRCVLACDSHRDCLPGAQDCVAAVEDDTGAAISVCSANGKAIGIGDSCPFPGQCDLLASCPDGSSCNLGQCGGEPALCARDVDACGTDEACTFGKCPNGDFCDIPTCPLDKCAPLTCITSGEGDANAYCTRPDCASDADCPGGYECGAIRDPHLICDSQSAGVSSLCGETAEPCVDRASFGDGNSYFEGPLCLMRKVCLKRAPCSSCETDLDCSMLGAQRCATIGDGKACARSCKGDIDCDRDYQCDVAAGACVPRFGSCKGAGNLCEPCRDDTDCGGAASGKVCFQGPLSGQLGCIDLTVTCRTDADCPRTPNQQRGSCTSDGTTDGQCLFPSINDSTSCW